MGWLLIALSILVLVPIIGYIYRRIRKGSNNQINIFIDERIKEYSKDNTNYVGQFDIELSELTHTDWLNLSDHDLTPKDFSYLVKWRNYGNKYSYRIVAACNDETDGATLSSEKITVNF